MDERDRLKTSQPGDMFQVGFGPQGGKVQEWMTVESNDGRAVVLKAGKPPHYVRVPLVVDAER